MRSADVRSLEHMFKSVTDGMEKIAEAIQSQSRRIARLEAENKELRSLWAQCEKLVIEHKSEEQQRREELVRMITLVNRMQFPKAQSGPEGENK